MLLAEVPFDAMLPWPLTPEQRASLLTTDTVLADALEATCRVEAFRAGWTWTDERPPLGDGLAFLAVEAPAGSSANPYVLVLAAWNDARDAVTVEAGLDVDCHCPRDHGLHRALEATWHPQSPGGFVRAWQLAHQTLRAWHESGFVGDQWRRQAGLPTAAVRATA